MERFGEERRFLVIFLGLFSWCDSGFSVPEQSGSNRRVAWLLQCFSSGLTVVFIRILWASPSVALRLFLLNVQEQDFEAGKHCSDDGADVRSFLLASPRQPWLPLHQHRHNRGLHRRNHLGCSLHNHRALWGQEFWRQPQHFGDQYTHWLLHLWGLCSLSLQETREDFWGQGRNLHRHAVLSHHFCRLGLSLLSWYLFGCIFS
nr:Major facilitator superfamily protein, putative isoform 2 [Ipomoea batatas]